jgi:pyruvate/2-oxoglutarate dehydrogenase complex dihydrolipoamide acyltransferase (E2) component
MIYSLTLPMGIEDVEEVRVLEWHGEPGHQFQAGDLVVELETHKALIEVSAGQAGILRRTFSAEGEWGAPGLPLAIFSDDAGEELPDTPEELAVLQVNFNIA